MVRLTGEVNRRSIEVLMGEPSTPIQYNSRVPANCAETAHPL